MVLQEYHNMCQDRRYKIRTAVKLNNLHNKEVVGGDNILGENIDFTKDIILQFTLRPLIGNLNK